MGLDDRLRDAMPKACLQCGMESYHVYVLPEEKAEKAKDGPGLYLVEIHGATCEHRKPHDGSWHFIPKPVEKQGRKKVKTDVPSGRGRHSGAPTS